MGRKTLWFMLALVAAGALGWGMAVYYSSGRLPGEGVAAGPDAIHLGRKQSIESAVLDEEREFYVALPDGYESRTEQTYPVVYVLDGERNFGHLSTMISYLANGRIPSVPPSIVVAIINTDRARDFTPTPLTTTLPEGAPPLDLSKAGGADRFLEFMDQELVPTIRQDYRTSGLSVLIGHSFGGLLALEALRVRPELFNGYVILDPSLWYDHPNFMNRVSESVARSDTRARVYMATAGEAGGQDSKLVQTMVDEQLSFAGDLENSRPPRLDFRFHHYPHEDHGTVFHIGSYDGLRWLFDGYGVNYKRAGLTAEVLKAHYGELSKRFGVRLAPTKAYLEDVSRYVGRNPDSEASSQAVEQLTRFYYP